MTAQTLTTDPTVAPHDPAPTDHGARVARRPLVVVPTYNGSLAKPVILGRYEME